MTNAQIIHLHVKTTNGQRTVFCFNPKGGFFIKDTLLRPSQHIKKIVFNHPAM